jgi:hypothetical protein
MAQLYVQIDPNFDSQTFRQDFDGQNFRCKFIWNETDECFEFELYDLDERLIASAPLRLGEIVFSDYSSDSLPQGDFLLVDLTGMGTPPSRFDIGVKAKLFYFESE